MEIVMMEMEMAICDEVRTVWWCGLRFAMAICDWRFCVGLVVWK
ncbi:hypothetical protein A2U01_0108919 [Trifolium medium]|uniref:Uncharacterized protein n=1 Tax=Trifolium medium TaxID=97028 RepID=A0A392VLF7_9FABA|nr:hypothetical protein [Trifolium medium]